MNIGLAKQAHSTIISSVYTRKLDLSTKSQGSSLSYLFAAMLALILCALPARAVDIVRLPSGIPALNILPFVYLLRSAGDEIMLSTAPTSDGLVRRIVVKSIKDGSQSDWAVFALKSESSETLTRWVVVPRGVLLGSDIWHPMMKGPHVVNLSSNIGTKPSPIPDAEADIFEIKIEAGSSITYVAELAGVTLPALEIWDPEAYITQSDQQSLIKLISLELTNIIAIALLALAVLRLRWSHVGAAVFGASIAYYQISQFGFLDNIVMPSEANTSHLQQPIAAIILLSGLFIFVMSQLDWRRWNLKIVSTLALTSFIAISFVGVAWIDGVVALDACRVAFASIVAISLLSYLALTLLRDRDAALMIPTLVLLFGWTALYVAAATAGVRGWYYYDDINPAGLSLVLLMLAITKMFKKPRLAQASEKGQPRKIAKILVTTITFSALTSAIFILIFSGTKIEISVAHDPLTNRLGPACSRYVVEEEEASKPVAEIRSSKVSRDVDVEVVGRIIEIKGIESDTMTQKDIEAQIRAAQGK